MSHNVAITLHSTMSDTPLPRGVVAGLWIDLYRDQAAMAILGQNGVVDYESFVSFVDSPVQIIIIAMCDGRIAALGWLDCLKHKSAHLHFLALKWSYGGINKLVCRAAVTHVLNIGMGNGEYMFDCLIGMTPTRNALATRFIQGVGMKVVGVVPLGYYDTVSGVSTDALCTYATRSDMK